MHRILLRQPQSATHTRGYFVGSTHGFRWLRGHILGVRYGPQSRALRCSMRCKSSGVVAYGLGRHRWCSRAKRGEEIWVVLPQMFDQSAWAVVLSSEIIKWTAETKAFRTTRSIGGHLSKVDCTMENATLQLAQSRLYLGGQQIGSFTMATSSTFDSFFFGCVAVDSRAVACKGYFSLRIQPRCSLTRDRTPSHGHRTSLPAASPRG